MRIIPLGCDDRRHRELIQQLMQKDDETLLIDIRIAPGAVAPGWNLTALRETYGERYLWFGPTLGDRNSRKNQPIDIVDLEAGLLDLQVLLWQGSTLLLMCECIPYNQCHRKIIATALAKIWSEVEIVLPEDMMGQQVLLARFQEQRRALERELNGPRPAPTRHWSSSDYEKGLFGKEFE